MYQVECIFKGFTQQNELMTKLPIDLIKNSDIFIQEFKVATDEIEQVTEEHDFPYYAEMGVLLLINENSALVRFLEQVSKTITYLVAQKKFMVIAINVGFEYYETPDDIPHKHLFPQENEII